MKNLKTNILSTILLFIAISIQAQNTPIDDLIKKYGFGEGVTSVSMSQQVLQSIFESSPIFSVGTDNNVRSLFSMNAPEVYRSITISKSENPAGLYTDLRNLLIASKYEQHMDLNEENNNMLGYYLKKVNDNTNEIMILRRQKEQFSAIYIKGNIDMKDIDNYLRRIRSALKNMSGSNYTDWPLTNTNDVSIFGFGRMVDVKIQSDTNNVVVFGAGRMKNGKLQMANPEIMKQEEARLNKEIQEKIKQEKILRNSW